MFSLMFFQIDLVADFILMLLSILLHLFYHPILILLASCYGGLRFFGFGPVVAAVFEHRLS